MDCSTVAVLDGGPDLEVHSRGPDQVARSEQDGPVLVNHLNVASDIKVAPVTQRTSSDPPL